ncbi:MAG: sigma-70 family RNA polymerase sigma factor [Burkholderiaceae bacterium]
MGTAEVARHQQQIESLYSDHHGWLLGWLRRKLGNAFDAADLAHDTFVRVLGKGPDHVVHEPRAYLTTIAGGLVASHWRRHALEQAWLEALAARPEPLAPSPEERHLILEALEEIAVLLEGLPAQVREAFLLSQLDGLTYPQIAERLGISVNVVQKAMTRAVTQCYKALYVAR